MDATNKGRKEYRGHTSIEATVDYLLYLLASALLLIGSYIFYRLGVQHFLRRDTRELIA